MKHIMYVFLFLLIPIACKKEGPQKLPENSGHLIFTFDHVFDDAPIVTDSLMYTNAAGNKFMINELMYFISDVTLYAGGKSAFVFNETNIHYVNIETPGTLTWAPEDSIPAGVYDSIVFTFGIAKPTNKNGLFVNAPEVNMAWPDILGGGFHYMMLNGKWLDTAGVLQNANVHLGIGQLYKSNTMDTDSIYEYVDNAFRVTPKQSAFGIIQQQTVNIQITMHVDSWFKTPVLYDFNVFGGKIMMKQHAMKTLCNNGYDVFTVNQLP